jgi:hypothetical protein
MEMLLDELEAKAMQGAYGCGINLSQGLLDLWILGLLV